MSATAMQAWTYSSPIWTRSFASAVDRLSSAKYHVPTLTLMERAGAAVANCVLENSKSQQIIIVLAGSGNNGGDALVAARILLGARRTVKIFLVEDQPHSQRSVSCQTQIAALANELIGNTSDALACLRNNNDIILVDGLIGSGMQHGLRDGASKSCLIAAQAIPQKYVIAIDIPSGMDCDNSTVRANLPANTTVTFGAKKLIHSLSPARDDCGQVEVHDIGFAPAAIVETEGFEPIIFAELNAHAIINDDPWQHLGRSANKYDRGHVLVIGGSDGKLGAPILTALAALRAGAGWCTVALPQPAWQKPEPGWPLELTFEDFYTGGQLSDERLQNFVTTRKVTALVIGPGTMSSLTKTNLQTLQNMQAQLGIGIVIDAGALGNILDLAPTFKPERTLLTPHPGEWQRLSTKILPTPHSPAATLEAIQQLRKSGFTAICKSATPIILPVTSGKARAIVCTSGDQTLARAGSGDVLAGIAGAHLAFGLPADFAAARSYAVLCAAAHRAASQVGPNAVLASDCIAHLGTCK